MVRSKFLNIIQFNLRSVVSSGANLRESGIIVFLVLIVAFFSWSSPYFFTLTSLQSILGASAIETVIAVGMVAAVIARQIDLSVGAIVGISAYAVGVTLDAGHSPLVGLMLALVLGALMGAINGIVVTKLGVPAIIATLGMASIYRGILYLLAPRFLGYMINASQIPSEFRSLSKTKVYEIPFMFVIALITVALVGILLTYTKWGRSLYAIGSNPEAARFAGISADSAVLKALVLVGTMSGLGGFLHVMRFASVNARTGSGLEFNVIAGVVVGGVAIFGGSGRVFGAALGVLLLNTLSRGFILMNIPEYWKVVATGIAIVLAIMLDAVMRHMRENRLRRTQRPHIKT